MSVSINKRISLSNQISSGSQSSLLLSSIEFKLTQNDETFRLKDSLQKKYKVLGAECNGSSETTNNIKQNLIKCADSNKVFLEWKQMKKIGAGLANLGNTCFMNSVLQCLSYIPPLVNFLLYSDEDQSAKCKMVSFCMTCELQKHIKRLYQNHGGIIKPLPIYQRLKSIAKHFQFGRQEDSHEFLRYVIDHMWKSCVYNYELIHNQKLDPASKETTIINHIFGGYMRSQVTCMVCKETSNTNDYFMDFILDIKNAATLEKALEKFTTPETLQADNAYKCQHCKKKVIAQKRFTVHQAPNVATFQFKRFDYHRMLGGKITKHVLYPEELNLRPYMSESKGNPIIYKLNCVLVHLGATANSGHYYCFVRNSNNVWYLMDDARVSQVPLAHVLNQQAYILFYVRVNSGKPKTFGLSVPVKVPEPESSKQASISQKIVTTTPVKIDIIEPSTTQKPAKTTLISDTRIKVEPSEQPTSVNNVSVSDRCKVGISELSTSPATSVSDNRVKEEVVEPSTQQKVVTSTPISERIKVETSEPSIAQVTNGETHASTNSKSSAWTVTDVNLKSPSIKSGCSGRSSSSSWVVTDKPVNGFAAAPEKSTWTVINISKPTDNKKDIPQRSESSSDASSELSSSESDDEVVWVERTKETIENELKKKCGETKTVPFKKWDEKVISKLSNGKDRSRTSLETDSSMNSHSVDKDDVPLTLNRMSLQAFGDGVRSWNGGPNEHDSVFRENGKRNRKYDEINEYNDDFDRGKVKKSKSQKRGFCDNSTFKKHPRKHFKNGYHHIHRGKYH